MRIQFTTEGTESTEFWNSDLYFVICAGACDWAKRSESLLKLNF